MGRSLVVASKKGEKSDANDLQKTFTKLKKKIEGLQKECQECTKTLDRHLLFCSQMLSPKIKEMGKLLREQVKLFYSCFKDKKGLNKEQREDCKYVIMSLFEQILRIEGPARMFDEELSAIHQKIMGFSPQTELLEQFEEFKEGLQSELSKSGIDIDISHMQFQGNMEETLGKIAEFLHEQKNREGAEKFTSFNKQTKTQSKKDKQKAEIAELQNKEIGTLYKQLAKEFHPDLETDPELKVKKEGLMKKLTCAYEEKDLYTLLALELEMLSVDSESSKVRTENQLKAYNNLLQSQVKMLQQQLASIPMDYKYVELQCYPSYKWKKGDYILHQIQLEIETDLCFHEDIVKLCQKGHIKDALEKVIDQHVLEEDDFDLLDFLG